MYDNAEECFEPLKDKSRKFECTMFRAIMGRMTTTSSERFTAGMVVLVGIFTTRNALPNSRNSLTPCKAFEP